MNVALDQSQLRERIFSGKCNVLKDRNCIIESYFAVAVCIAPEVFTVVDRIGCRLCRICYRLNIGDRSAFICRLGNLCKNNCSFAVSRAKGTLFELFDEVPCFSSVICASTFLVTFICSIALLN